MSPALVHSRLLIVKTDGGPFLALIQISNRARQLCDGFDRKDVRSWRLKLKTQYRCLPA
jgi:hypothetical protein